MIPIFVINLERESKKRVRITSQLEKLGLSFTLVKAIEGKSLSEKEIDGVYSSQNAIQIFKRELSLGEIGCALSHLSVYRKMVENEISIALILEDDVTLCSELPDILSHVDLLPEECDALLLGYDADIKRDLFLYTSFWQNKRFFGKYRIAPYVKVALGTYGYILRLEGAKKLLKAIQKIEKPIDHYTGSWKYLHVQCLYPRCVSIAEHGLNESEIDSERRELKKVLHTTRYNHWITRWLNRFRLGFRLLILKVLPLGIARRYASHIFRNRRV